MSFFRLEFFWPWVFSKCLLNYEPCFIPGGSLLSTKADTKALTGKESSQNQDKVAAPKQSSKAATAVSEKKARFSESVTTHEYVETESETKAKSRIVKSALNAEEEAEKVENECKQS